MATPDGPRQPAPRRTAAWVPADILRRALGIAAAVAAFGLGFGVLCADTGLSLAQAVGFSALVFTGSAQFAAVSVLAGGGGAAAAVVAGLLLNLRLLPFGVALARILDLPLPTRLAASQLLIDESSVLALAESDPDRARRAFFAAGVAVFVLWNAATVGGALLGGAVGQERLLAFGLDAAFPAVFLALLWDRLRSPAGRLAAAAGGAVALGLTPVASPGVPIAVASIGALAAYPLLRSEERRR